MRRSGSRAVAAVGLLVAAALGVVPRLATGQLIIHAPCTGNHRWDSDCPGPRTPDEKVERERQIAAQAAAAERARKEREAFEARVAAEVARLGAKREADARRLVTMREAAEKAAGLERAPPPAGDAPRPPPKKCKTRETSGPTSGVGTTEQEARQSMDSTVAKRCKLTSATCQSPFRGWFTCRGTWVCPSVEFACSPVVKA